MEEHRPARAFRASPWLRPAFARRLSAARALGARP
jgi:hypothetical protein